MSVTKKKAEGGGYVVTALPYDGLFGADLIDTQIMNKGKTRKFVEMVYCCLDNEVVTITKNGKEVELPYVRSLDILKSDEAIEFYEIGDLIERAITTSEDDVKK